jgi:hypothetical protein
MLKTKICQREAQVAEYKERENEWEQVLEDIFVVLLKELLKKEEVVATPMSEMSNLENQKSEMEQKCEQERHRLKTKISEIRSEKKEKID